MICHSQRAIHTCNALIDYPDELRKRIHVVAIAPAAYIYEETCGSVIHDRALWWQDFIPWAADHKGAFRESHNLIALDSHHKLHYSTTNL